jgi:Outer membrane protein beta-barrel domain
MKHFILSSFLSLIFINNVYAQKFDYGIKIGGNANNLHVQFTPEIKDSNYKDVYHSSFGFHGGLFMAIDISKKFSYRQEVEYIQKGSFMRVPGSYNPTDKLIITFIQFPVIFSYRPIPKLNIELGPTFGSMLSCKTENGRFASNVNDYNTKFEVSVAGGLRYSIFNRFDIQARYSLGLSSLSKNVKYLREDPDTGETYYTEFSAKSRVLSLSVLYYIKRQ